MSVYKTGEIRFGSLANLLAVAGVISLCCSQAMAQSSRGDASSPAANAAQYQLHVNTNLVVVRVVVRDAHSNPVEGLTKDDFRLFDNGKEQSIAQFELKAPQPEAPGSAGNPAHFTALFFDDLDTPLAYLTYARDAADRFLTNNLRGSDRAALVTTSGSNMVEFTSDLKQLHDALFKIAPNEHGGDPRNQAARNLHVLDQLVVRVSQMPGQRTIILVSTGFMSGSQQAEVNAIINRALGSEIAISSIDPRGLAPPPSADVLSMVPETAPPTAILPRNSSMRDGMPPEPSAADRSMDSLDPDVLIAPEIVLRELADGTGGEYFHDNNDLSAGLLRLSAMAEAYYILAFTPHQLNSDGRYHSLKVILTAKQRGFSVQARRGYFAPPSHPSAAEQEDEEIRQALLSDSHSEQLPVALGASVSAETGGSRELSLVAHLDARRLRFQKEGAHNLNTVTFVFGIFDQNGSVVGLKRRRAHINVLDDQLPELFKAGVDVDMSFELKPGIYRVREVVTDSEEHQLTTFSKNLKIP